MKDRKLKTKQNKINSSKYLWTLPCNHGLESQVLSYIEKKTSFVLKLLATKRYNVCKKNTQLNIIVIKNAIYHIGVRYFVGGPWKPN